MLNPSKTAAPMENPSVIDMGTLYFQKLGRSVWTSREKYEEEENIWRWNRAVMGIGLEGIDGGHPNS